MSTAIGVDDRHDDERNTHEHATGRERPGDTYPVGHLAGDKLGEDVHAVLIASMQIVFKREYEQPSAARPPGWPEKIGTTSEELGVE